MKKQALLRLTTRSGLLLLAYSACAYPQAPVTFIRSDALGPIPIALSEEQAAAMGEEARLHPNGNMLGAPAPTPEQLKAQEASMPLDQLVVYTPQSHPQLPWDKMAADALAAANDTDAYTTYATLNGPEIIKHNMGPGSVIQVLGAPICWDFTQHFEGDVIMVSSQVGYSGVPLSESNHEYYGVMMNPPSCIGNWSTNVGYRLSWSIAANAANNWGKDLHVYIYVFDANDKLLADVDVTQYNQEYIPFSGFPLNTRYMYHVKILTPGPLVNPPGVSLLNFRVDGY